MFALVRAKHAARRLPLSVSLPPASLGAGRHHVPSTLPGVTCISGLLELTSGPGLVSCNRSFAALSLPGILPSWMRSGELQDVAKAASARDVPELREALKAMKSSEGDRETTVPVSAMYGRDDFQTVQIPLLHYAQMSGKLLEEEMASALVDSGLRTDWDVTFDGLTALQRAVISGNYGLAEILLRAGANPNSVADSPSTHHSPESAVVDHSGHRLPPLVLAIIRSDASMARLLVDYGARWWGPDAGPSEDSFQDVLDEARVAGSFVTRVVLTSLLRAEGLLRGSEVPTAAEALARLRSRSMDADADSASGGRSALKSPKIGAVAAGGVELHDHAVARTAKLTELAYLRPEVQAFIQDLEHVINAELARRESGTRRIIRPHHIDMVFVGNVGAGKQSAARIVTQVLSESGLIPNCTLQAADALYLQHLYSRGQLVDFLTQSDVLFVENASKLASDHLVLHMLLRVIHEQRTYSLAENKVLVLSCAPTELHTLERAIQGLRSRFPLWLSLPDLSTQQIVAMTTRRVENLGLTISSDAMGPLSTMLEASDVSSSAPNLYSVQGLVTGAMLAQARRLASGSKADSSPDPSRLCGLTLADFEAAVSSLVGSMETPGTTSPSGHAESPHAGGGSTSSTDGSDLVGTDQHSISRALGDLNKIVGLQEVKSFVRALYFRTIVTNARRSMGVDEPGSAPPVGGLNMIFKGSPGTGKSTVAHIVSRLLKELGLLKRGHLVVARRADLVGEYLGQTSPRTTEVINSAMGGVLFIDEAYGLVTSKQDSYGREALTTLVDLMEANRGNLCVILAGYSHEMEELLDVNPGLRSRFPNVLTFANYSATELEEIALGMLNAERYELDPGALPGLRELLGRVASECSGNARSARNLVGKLILQHATRVALVQNPSRDDLVFIRLEDVEAIEDISDL